MTDQQPAPPASLGMMLLGSATRHGATYLAGVLVGLGAISGNQEAQTASVVASLLTYGAMQVWSIIQKARTARP